MKQNRCKADFKCDNLDDVSKMDCVYRTTKHNHDCDYTDKDGNCQSSVARVNAMILECKKLGIKLITKEAKVTETDPEGERIFEENFYEFIGE